MVCGAWMPARCGRSEITGPSFSGIQDLPSAGQRDITEGRVRRSGAGALLEVLHRRGVSRLHQRVHFFLGHIELGRAVTLGGQAADLRGVDAHLLAIVRSHDGVHGALDASR